MPSRGSWFFHFSPGVSFDPQFSYATRIERTLYVHFVSSGICFGHAPLRLYAVQSQKIGVVVYKATWWILAEKSRLSGILTQES